uniref:NAD(P)H oxidase (H2O2-forming) n=1 Tax=Scylla paramamosain TaxID=85552 RepID=A0A346GBC0_SCYPA|nr:dual oxidase [Scylla paramamosain]
MRKAVLSWIVVVVVWGAASEGAGQSAPLLRPDPRQWAARQTRERFGFLDWLIGNCSSNSGDGGGRRCQHQEPEFEGYDGWYNNLARPSLGAVDTPLLRLLPAAYSDGVYQLVNHSTNPLTLSDQLMNGDNGNHSTGGRTAFQVFFGQQVVEEIVDAQGAGCPPEYHNIPIEEGHEYRRHPPHMREMPFLRTRYDATTGLSPNNPRQQLNEITPYLDGGLVYGTSKAWADMLRTFPDGTLAPRGQLAWNQKLGQGFPARNKEWLPMANPPPPTNHSQYVAQGHTAPVDRFFKLGNPRGSENPFLLTFGIMWFRWHNYIARYLANHHRAWSDEKVFNEARKWVIATYQAVVFYDWLPKYLRTNPSEYKGYKVTTDPQISQVFQSAAMRFGHTLVPSGVHLRTRSKEGCIPLSHRLSQGPRHHLDGVRTCNSFWRTPELFADDSGNFERFLMGLSSQSSEREDNIVVEDLRGHVFGPLEFSRRDLMAINIQRGRDHGLPDYNTARQFFGLSRLHSLDPKEFKRKTGAEVDISVLKRLQKLYQNDPNKVDIWVGGLLETHSSAPGDLFSRIILDQFERIREGDRFWFENNNNKLFTPEEQERLRQTRIIDVLLTVTTLLPEDDIQLDPFTAVHDKNRVSEVCLREFTLEARCTLPQGNTTRCQYLPQINSVNAEKCTPLHTYDYFSGSEVSYILTFTLVLGACVAMFVWIIVMNRTLADDMTRDTLRNIALPDNVHKAKEKVTRMKSRYVVLELDKAIRHLQVKNIQLNLLRTIDLNNVKVVTVRHLKDFRELIVTVANHYDLSLVFEGASHGRKFFEDLKDFCEDLDLDLRHKQEGRLSIKFGVTTVYDRQKKLAELCRFVMHHTVYKEKTPKKVEQNKSFFIDITLDELANELGMVPENLFVKQLFRRMDTNKDGFITVKEFWDVMEVLAKGKPEEKARLVFDIYDINQSNFLYTEDLVRLIQSGCGYDSTDAKSLAKAMMKSAGMLKDEGISFEKFKNIVLHPGSIFRKVSLHIGKDRQLTRSFSIDNFESFRGRLESETGDTKDDDTDSAFSQWYNGWINSIGSKIQYVFWLVLYTIVMFLIFAEGAYFFSVEREHRGLRRIAGYGVTVTRGAASAMMFTYSTLIVTMCRNLFAVLRSTFLQRIIPFDHMVEFHRYMASWALVWTVVHIVGHAINFYHISTQTASDLTCLFRDFFRSTHVLPKFHYWCWETITGLTGVLLTLQTALIYIFAYFGRTNFFRHFWVTHNTYPIFYVLFVLHGSGMLVQRPFFHYFFLGPCFLFLLDKLVSISRNKIKIDIISVAQLPSDVIRLEIRRPPNFNFRSGQWVKIASTGISGQEYHPFTLSSAPHVKNLTLHIRAVGPWTRKLAEVYGDKIGNEKYPEIYMDGPFGEGHQTWWDYQVVVLVAGGIGVTPFASILRDMVNRLQNSTKMMRTKQVLFLWTTGSQKQYEWMIDILREVEASDKNKIIRIHIFITQFRSKFDLRTIMLYMADRFYQSESGISLFTQLRAITHFGRPDFDAILRTIKKKCKANLIGVFTCGSPGLSRSVEESCREMNKSPDVIFRHYYKNF